LVLDKVIGKTKRLSSQLLQQ